MHWNKTLNPSFYLAIWKKKILVYSNLASKTCNAICYMHIRKCNNILSKKNIIKIISIVIVILPKSYDKNKPNILFFLKADHSQISERTNAVQFKFGCFCSKQSSNAGVVT